MKNKITYTQINGINYPDLALPEQPEVNTGKYGQMRLEFLKKHRRGTYTTLLTEGALSRHLFAIGQEARSQVEFLTAELAKQRGVDESIKASNPLLWVQEMNGAESFDSAPAKMRSGILIFAGVNFVFAHRNIKEAGIKRQNGGILPPRSPIGAASLQMTQPRFAGDALPMIILLL